MAGLPDPDRKFSLIVARNFAHVFIDVCQHRSAFHTWISFPYRWMTGLSRIPFSSNNRPKWFTAFHLGTHFLKVVWKVVWEKSIAMVDYFGKHSRIWMRFWSLFSYQDICQPWSAKSLYSVEKISRVSSILARSRIFATHFTNSPLIIVNIPAKE